MNDFGNIKGEYSAALSPTPIEINKLVELALTYMLLNSGVWKVLSLFNVMSGPFKR